MSPTVKYVGPCTATYYYFIMFLLSQSIFNGPFKRAELLLLPQYAASDSFLAAGKWTGTKTHILSVNGGDSEKSTVPLYCIVVGTISADKSYLGKHGNFSQKFNDNALKAKLQFTVTRPNDIDFGPDFDKAVVAFEDHQRVISETPRHLYFLLKEQGNAMRMNFGLFEPKVSNSKSQPALFSPALIPPSILPRVVTNMMVNITIKLVIKYNLI